MLQTDLELIKNVKEKNCENSLFELINRHSGIVLSTFQKYSNALKSKNVDLEEIFKEKDYLIYTSILSFNPEKGSQFHSWLCNQCRFFCLNWMNKVNRKPLILVEEKDLSLLIENRRENHQDATSGLYEYAFNLLDSLKDKRIRKVFQLKYIENYPSLKTIGKKMGLSHQTIANLHNKGLKILKNKYLAELK